MQVRDALFLMPVWLIFVIGSRHNQFSHSVYGWLDLRMDYLIATSPDDGNAAIPSKFLTKISLSLHPSEDFIRSHLADQSPGSFQQDLAEAFLSKSEKRSCTWTTSELDSIRLLAQLLSKSFARLDHLPILPNVGIFGMMQNLGTIRKKPYNPIPFNVVFLFLTLY